MRLTVGVSFKKASRRQRRGAHAPAGAARRRLSSFRRLFGPVLHPRTHANRTRPRTRVSRADFYFDRLKYIPVLIDELAGIPFSLRLFGVDLREKIF